MGTLQMHGHQKLMYAAPFRRREFHLYKKTVSAFFFAFSPHSLRKTLWLAMLRHLKLNEWKEKRHKKKMRTDELELQLS